nr:MAG TPA: hypothetical protein [Caudoviricetes sp.]
MRYNVSIKKPRLVVTGFPFLRGFHLIVRVIENVISNFFRVQREPIRTDQETRTILVHEELAEHHRLFVIAAAIYSGNLFVHGVTLGQASGNQDFLESPPVGTKVAIALRFFLKPISKHLCGKGHDVSRVPVCFKVRKELLLLSLDVVRVVQKFRVHVFSLNHV